MWEAAIEQTGDAFLALHLAETQSFAANRTTSLIMESSATVLEAFELAAKYSALIADVMAVEIGEIRTTRFTLILRTTSTGLSNHKSVVRDCLNIARS